MRFRILNGSNARIYRFALSNGDPLVQIATDGGLLPTPVSRSSITLSPGERVEVVIDFANYAPGTSLILKNYETTFTPQIADVMRFDVIGDSPRDKSQVPAALSQTLSGTRKLGAIVPSIHREFSLEAGTVNGRTVWTVNGVLYDPARVDVKPRLNTTETWTFTNNSGQPHPMHIHDIQWRIRDINGLAPSPGDDGWKDTFLVPARGSVTVVGTFVDNFGPYVSHCHNLEHEDHAMMFNFEVQQ